jgi:hypothetical protein
MMNFIYEGYLGPLEATGVEALADEQLEVRNKRSAARLRLGWSRALMRCGPDRELLISNF